MKPLIFIISTSFFLISSTLIQKSDYSLSDDFTMTIAGTSSLHDWESTVEKLEGVVNLSFGEDGTITINECTVKAHAASIKSTKGSIMDKKTHKALKTDEFAFITFKMEKVLSSTKTADAFTASVQGNLSIAGVTKNITLKVKGKTLEDGAVEFMGEQSLKMTDFDIDPPTALLGTLKTGDDITVKFRTVFKKK